MESLVRRVFAVPGIAMRDQAFNGHGVADHKSSEFPGLAQNVLQQEVVSRGRDLIQVHVGAHQAADAGVNRGLERREIHVPQQIVGYKRRVVISTAVGRAVRREVLDATQHMAGCAQFRPLEAPHLCLRHRAPRYGSSPAPSTIRPQRASRAMSTVGANVQLMPAARASRAAIVCPRSTSDGSHVADIASGGGNIVWYPWMTSSPISNGICSRDSSTAILCSRLMSAGSETHSTEPASPLRTSSSSLGASFANVPPAWLSCPIFSSRVIRFSTVSARCSALSAVDDFAACP